jgi:hypothetical protein
MIFTPIAGWVILGVIAVIVLTSAVTEILLLFAAYTALVVLLNALALGIEGESYWYLGYAPLFVLGYKQFNDLVMVKSIVDVIRETELEWTNASRIEQRDGTATTPLDETPSDRRSD